MHGDHQQKLLVPADSDSAPVRFELEATRPGVRSVRLRAWDGGSCVAEVYAEVTIDEYARGWGDSFSEAELQSESLRDEVTLEVTHYATDGQNRYGFRFRDAGMRYPEEFRPLRYDPTVDAEGLIRRINTIVETGRSRGPNDTARSVRKASSCGTTWCPPRFSGSSGTAWPGSSSSAESCPTRMSSRGSCCIPGLALGSLVTGDFPVTRTVEKWRWSRQLYKSPARFVVPRQPVDVPGGGAGSARPAGHSRRDRAEHLDPDRAAKADRRRWLRHPPLRLSRRLQPG